MKTRCDWADRIESATLRDTLSDEEEAHTRSCAECREVVKVVRLLAAQGRAAERRGARHIPSAQAVLAGARRIRARKAERAALKPIIWMERIAAVLAAGTLVSVAWWLARRLPDWTDLRAAFEPQASAGTDPVSIAFLGTAVLLVLVTLYGLVGPRRGR